MYNPRRPFFNTCRPCVEACKNDVRPSSVLFVGEICPIAPAANVTAGTCASVPMTVNATTGQWTTDGISAFSPLYQTVTIDPYGNLFGRTPCGVLNFHDWLR